MDSPCIKQNVCKVLKIFQLGKYLVAYVLKGNRVYNALYVYCRGRAVTNVGKTCGPTPSFVLAINTFKLN